MRSLENESSSGTHSCPLCGCWIGKIKYIVDHFRIVTCKQCGFVYLQNPLTETADPETYQEYFQNAEPVSNITCGDGKREENPWNIYNKRIDLVKSICPKGKLLEIGSGRGYFLSVAQKNGYSVQGIEISPNAARYAHEKFNVNVLTGDMEKMALPADKFDIITMWHVLEHFYNPLQVLKQAGNMLNDNGVMFIEVPNLDSIKFRLANDRNRWSGGNHPRYHLSFFTMNSLARILLQSGFREVKPLYINYTPVRITVKSLLKRVLYTMNMDSFLTLLVRK